MYARLWPDALPLTAAEEALLTPYFREEISLNELATRVQAYYSACVQEEERAAQSPKSAALIK